MVLALNQLFLFNYHVITEVIEAEFVISSVSNVFAIGFSSAFRIWFVIVNTGNFQPVEIEDWFVPFGITFCKIVVNGDNMNTTFCKCIQVSREDSYQSFTFTGFHFCDLTLMKCNGTNQLYIIRNHIPFNFIAGYFPAFTDKSTAGIFKHGISFGQNVI